MTVVNLPRLKRWLFVLKMGRSVTDFPYAVDNGSGCEPAPLAKAATATISIQCRK
jgi:hypothetical protein